MTANIYLKARNKVVTVNGLSEVRVDTLGGAGARTIQPEAVATIELTGKTLYSFVGEHSTAVFSADAILFVEFKDN